MQGDSLASVRYPNSVEARLKRAEASLREIRATMQDLLAAASLISGPDGSNGGLPMPDADTITATFGTEFATDGTFQPTLSVVVDASFAQLRGFSGYGVRLTSPDGSKSYFQSTIALAADENSIVVNPIVVKQVVPPPVGTANQVYTVAARVENSLFGVGRWSEEVAVTTANDTTPPPQPTGLVISGSRFNVVHLDWDASTAADYFGSNVYVTHAALTDLLVATVKGHSAEFNYDSILSAAWVNVYVVDFDRSGNTSTPSVAVPIVKRLAQNTDLDVITDPSRFAPWTSTGTRWEIRDSTGVGRVSIWLDTGAYAGNYMYRIQGEAVAGVETGFRWQTSNGAFIWLDPTDGSVQLSGAGGVPLLTLDATGVTTNSALNLGLVAAFTASGAINAAMFYITADATLGNMTLTLPAATVGGRTYPIKRIDATANTVTVLAAGTDTIDGAASVNLAAQWDTLTLVSNGAGAWYRWSPHDTRSIDFIIGGTGSILTVGDQFWVKFDFPCTLTGATLTADVSGSTVIDILKTTYVSFPAGFTSICAATKPTLSSAQKSEDTTLTGWTTQIQAGDMLKFNVNSATAITQVTLGLRVSI